jgi:pimeloyl-ACP methyl ester carboxylesterase
MKNILVFIHGLESSALGTKGQYFRQHFPQMIIEDFTGDFKARMHKLNDILRGMDNLVIVGSSYGGAMAVQYALNNEKNIRKLILLAPALHLNELSLPSNKLFRVPVIIYHGLQDNVVEPHLVEKIARKFFVNLKHHFVADDHSLHDTFPLLDWRALLETAS